MFKQRTINFLFIFIILLGELLTTVASYTISQPSKIVVDAMCCSTSQKSTDGCCAKECECPKTSHHNYSKHGFFLMPLVCSEISISCIQKKIVKQLKYTALYFNYLHQLKTFFLSEVINLTFDRVVLFAFFLE